MKFTEETMTAIEQEYYKERRKNHYGNGVLGLEIHGDRLVHNGCMVICEITDLSMVIDELTMYKTAIEKITGITF